MEGDCRFPMPMPCNNTPSPSVPTHHTTPHHTQGVGFQFHSPLLVLFPFPHPPHPRLSRQPKNSRAPTPPSSSRGQTATSHPHPPTTRRRPVWCPLNPATTSRSELAAAGMGMKKLYQGKGRRVHPAPAAAPSASDAALAMLPATLLALVAALTPEEQEVLAYLLSGGAGGAAGGGAGGGRRRRLNGPHQPEMGCGCFGCYKSFWARWDASPNRHLIHRIIDAVEEGSASGAPGAGAGGATRRGHRRRRRGRGGRAIDVAAAGDEAAETGVGVAEHHHHHHHMEEACCASDGGDYEGDEDDGADSVYGAEEEAMMTDDSDCSNPDNAAAAEKSAVGKLVRFIGEKVWAAWT